jgi:hypothetical protein
MYFYMPLMSLDLKCCSEMGLVVDTSLTKGCSATQQLTSIYIFEACETKTPNQGIL